MSGSQPRSRRCSRPAAETAEARRPLPRAEPAPAPPARASDSRRRAGGRPHARDLRGPAVEGPPARLGGRRLRVARLRPATASSTRSRERLEDRRRDRGREGPARALPEPGRRHVRGRHRPRRESAATAAGAPECRVARLRRRRPARLFVTASGRTRSTGTGATARSRTSRERPASRAPAGTRARASSTPTATAASTSTSPRTSPAARGRACTRSGRSTGRASRTSRSGPFGLKGAPDHFFRSDGNGGFRRRDGGVGADRPRARVRVQRPGGGPRSGRRPRPLRRERLGRELPLPERRQGSLRGGRALVGLRARQERRRAGGHGRHRRRRQRGRPRRTSFVTNFAEDFSTLYLGTGPGVLRGRERRRAASARRPTFRCRGARRSATSTATATSTSRSRTATSIRRSTHFPDAGQTYAQRHAAPREPREGPLRRRFRPRGSGVSDERA